MIGGNPNYWNLYATKGHNHDDMYSKLGHEHLNICPLYNYNGLTSYTDTPFGLSYFMNGGDSQNGLPHYHSITLTVKGNENRQWQFSGHTAGAGLWYRASHVNNTGGTATGWSPWQRVGLNLNRYGKWWNEGYVSVATNGVAHIGKFLNFHETHEDSSDYCTQLYGGNNVLYSTGNFYPATNGNRQIGSTSLRWQWINLVNNPSVSSDRNLKENIQYIRNNSFSNENNFTYNDMYSFVKDDLELAKYNFKGQKEIKLNFIAQDLLYNLDGTDNKIGQFIVPPIPVPTEEEKAEIISNLEDGQEYQDPTLSYDMGNYISVLTGALKVSINKIEELTNRVEILEQTVNQLLDKVNSDL